MGTEMQKEVNKILDWAQRWKMAINADKTKTLIISTSTVDRGWNPRIKVEGRELKKTSEYRFLSVTIDNQLRINQPVENVAEKARKRVDILQCMATKNWATQWSCRGDCI